MNTKLITRFAVAGAALLIGGVAATGRLIPPTRRVSVRPVTTGGGHLGTLAIFPPSNPWNQRVDKLPVDPNSAKLIASMTPDRPLHPDFGTVWNNAPNGIPYLVVSGKEPRVPVRFDYTDESDPGPYPIPLTAPIEGGPNGDGDRHVIAIDKDHKKLYELFAAHAEGGGWHAGSGAIFNLTSNELRSAGWTSADAAGLPIFPGLVRYDEVFGTGAINHALRFTVRTTRRAYVKPARHWASKETDSNLPPMGMRVRLKASFDISGYPREDKIILTALKRYGMFLADNGSDWFISGVPNPKWSDSNLGLLKQVKGRDFEVVKMDQIVTP